MVPPPIPRPAFRAAVPAYLPLTFRCCLDRESLKVMGGVGVIPNPGERRPSLLRLLAFVCGVAEPITDLRDALLYKRLFQTVQNANREGLGPASRPG